MVIKVSAQQSRITYLKYFRKAVAGNFADEPIQMISLNIKWLTSFGKRETNENYNNIMCNYKNLLCRPMMKAA